MRVTRAKQYRRHLRFFRIVYGIAPPYKVILDGNFIHQCITSKVDIEARLASVLQGASVRLFTPRAAQVELEALGPDFVPAFQFAKKRCRALSVPSGEDLVLQEGRGGEGNAEGDDPATQIAAAVGKDNAGKFIVASQDDELRSQLRRVAGCPLIHITRTVVLMEAPSGKTKATFEKAEVCP
ncbi:unnamed protein product [Discosporangium mesarthrocarpum]